MNWFKEILIKRILKAVLASFNPNSSTFYIGIVNWIVVTVFQHFGWLTSLGITPEGLHMWLITTGGVWLQQILSKIVNGAFPSVSYGALTPAQASMPSVPGTPVLAVVASTPAVTAAASGDATATSAVKR